MLPPLSTLLYSISNYFEIDIVIIICYNLKKGGVKMSEIKCIGVIAPSSSALRMGDSMDLAKSKLNQLGFTIKYGSHIFECDALFSSSIKQRIEDLHQVFLDKEIDLVMSATGGFNCNEILPYIDYELVNNNYKPICGYSDITALLNALYTKTGKINYLGVHYSSFAMAKGFEYSLNSFLSTIHQKQTTYYASEFYSDDAWYLDQDNRNFYKSEGWKVYSPGISSGTLLGGNLCTFNLLQGTPYMPSLKESIILIEEKGEVYKEATPFEFNRNLESLIQCHDFSQVKGLIIGRMQLSSQFTKDQLLTILDSKPILKDIPVLYDVDCSHTTPLLTLPIGGHITLDTYHKSISIYD